MASAKQTSAISSTTVRSKFESALRALGPRPIRGEYKLWVYQYYLAPSFHFYLAVNPTSSTLIKQMEAMATKAIKKWLKLPRNATQAILYHPKVLNVPKAQNIKLEAKLSLLAAINRFIDHLIQELKPRLSSNSLTQGTLDIHSFCMRRHLRSCWSVCYLSTSSEEEM